MKSCNSFKNEAKGRNEGRMSALEARWGSGHGGEMGIVILENCLKCNQAAQQKEAADSGKCLIRAVMEFNSQDWELNSP